MILLDAATTDIFIYENTQPNILDIQGGSNMTRTDLCVNSV
jgi:hypothetical protein